MGLLPESFAPQPRELLDFDLLFGFRLCKAPLLHGQLVPAATKRHTTLEVIDVPTFPIHQLVRRCPTQRCVRTTEGKEQQAVAVSKAEGRSRRWGSRLRGAKPMTGCAGCERSNMTCTSVTCARSGQHRRGCKCGQGRGRGRGRVTFFYEVLEMILSYTIRID